MMKRLTLLCANLLIIFIAQSQTLTWVKQLGGSSTDHGYSIAVDGLGNVYTTGSFKGTADFDPGPGVANLTSVAEEDIFISKLNAAGNFVWVKQLGGNSIDIGRGIATDAAGNVYITGSFRGFADFDPSPSSLNFGSRGGWDIFIAKLDPSGNLLWATQYGDIADDFGNAITVDAAGNVYTTGSFGGTIDFDPGLFVYNLIAKPHDIFVSKLNSSGKLVWAKNWSTDYTVQGNGIAVDAAGNVYTTGQFLGKGDFDPGPGTLMFDSHITGGPYPAEFDMFISKLDAAGNLVWAKQLSGVQWYYCYGYSIAVDAWGNVYTTGTFRETVDFDPGPGIFNVASGGINDGFVMKLNAAGNFQWAKIMGGCQNEDHGNSITVDGLGNVYTTGVFQYLGDFDPGPATYDILSAGSIDAYISKLDSAGKFVWAKHLGGVANDYGYSTVVDASGNVYTAGYFEGTADFDPDNGVMNMTPYGGADVFVHKLSQVIVLPFQWLSFTAQKQGSNALLTWKIANGKNTKNFTVQHSTKGSTWNNISVIAPKSDTNTVKEYSYVHTDPVNDTNYYRIMYTDISGTNSFSDIRSVKFSIDPFAITLLKNPVTNGNLQVKVNSTTTLSLFNDNGLLLWKELVMPGIININVSGFAKGMYLLKTNNQSKKILLQ